MKTKSNKKKVVAIGGGTGTIPVLSGLKNHKDLDLSVIVSMMDEGGSNRVVRDEFGLLPLSDLRKSIIALSEKGNGLFRELFTYRFDKGKGFKGHTLGNIIMMALSDITGSELGAVKASCKLFDVSGEVIPVTLENVRLVAEFEDGDVICGEHLIDEPEVERNERIVNFYLKPKAKANPEARKAIKEADFIIAGPGDSYTSTLANIIVDGIPDAFKENEGEFIFISNLMTKNGQTRGMGVRDLVNEISKYTKRKPDTVLVNNAPIAKEIIQKYFKLEGEKPILDDTTDKEDYIVVRDDLISNSEVAKDKGDYLKRSLSRHDPQKLGRVLYEIISGNRF
ncbi:YvcK family protein [Candidatus Dojkabacteria bacterium]|nr:YvcK family protein [Candidatus Dojkabacteria bacterium]